MSAMASETCWFVECRIGDQFRGWIAAQQKPDKWTNFTIDPNKAKRYTKEEADIAVLKISAFHGPKRPYTWLATEHMFDDGKTTDQVSGSTSPA